MNPSFRELCTPAKIYFAIAVIASVFSLFNGIGIIAVGLNLMFAFIWTFVLGWLCKKGLTNISWFLVLLPYIIIALAMFGIYQVTEEQRQIMRTIKLQGAYGQEAFVDAENPQFSSCQAKCSDKKINSSCMMGCQTRFGKFSTKWGRNYSR